MVILVLASPQRRRRNVWSRGSVLQPRTATMKERVEVSDSERHLASYLGFGVDDMHNQGLDRFKIERHLFDLQSNTIYIRTVLVH